MSDRNPMTCKTMRFLIGLCLFGTGCSQPYIAVELVPDLKLASERFFLNLRQLTRGGINGGAHWSFDGQWLSLQHKGPGLLNENPNCDQIYKMNSRDGSEVKRLSNGQGQ